MLCWTGNPPKFQGEYRIASVAMRVMVVNQSCFRSTILPAARSRNSAHGHRVKSAGGRWVRRQVAMPAKKVFKRDGGGSKAVNARCFCAAHRRPTPPSGPPAALQRLSRGPQQACPYRCCVGEGPPVVGVPYVAGGALESRDSFRTPTTTDPVFCPALQRPVSCSPVAPALCCGASGRWPL